MGRPQPGEAVPGYRAFVSYSHSDARFAGWLHRKLEGWRAADGQRLTPIFIDRAELAAGPDLSAQVRDALAQSAALIVIASPAARASRWVSQEIALFRELNPDRPVLAALIAGEPDQAFPEVLLRHQGRAVEPLAADFRDGQDGKRLGLLKIVAGLTAQPLDRLVQRDAQGRQRRVMAVTAATALLSLILATALIVAVRARAEAERQRADAEGLVEFMLTDLRDKLKGVGRLDIMDTVNQRVMTRYAEESKATNLPEDILLRRARLLQAMAEDDLASINHFDRGLAEAQTAARITLDLWRRTPRSAAIILSHAKSEFWLGQAKFLDKRIPATQRASQAKPHWRQYRQLTVDLAARTDAEPEWLVEAGYAEGNLCAVALAKPAEPREASIHCEAATRQLEAAYRLRRDDTDIALNLANAYAWQADAKVAVNDFRTAIELRRRQSALVEDLARKNPLDQRIAEARLLADFGLARLLIDKGLLGQAKPILARADARARELQSHDPENGDWANWRSQVSTLRKKLP